MDSDGAMSGRERQLAALQSWQPGQSGNPAGRPKNTPLVSPALRRFAEMPVIELRELLNAVTENAVPEGLTVAEALALVMIKKGLTEVAWGDGTRDKIIERIDGKAADTSVTVNVGVQVNLGWSDGQSA